MRGARQERTRRDRLLARAARRIADGAPARKVCRELGTSEAELAEWLCRRSSQVADLEAENRGLREALADMRCHRRMLLGAFDLIFPPSKLGGAPRGEARADARGESESRTKRHGFVM
jgi:hypothetical protein